jgi:murein DD-endopeptidase MepM/ murein hydrolase activator NlpD
MVMKDERRMTFIVIPHGAGADLSTRSYEIRYRTLRIALLAGSGLGVALFLMAASWFWMAAQAARIPGFQREVADLQRDRQRLEQLARTVARMEAQYEQVRSLLGRGPSRPDSSAAAADTADPAAADDPGGAAGSRGDSAQASLPRAWPLAARGFVTRGHLAATPGRHPGIDIAVTAGSRILAAGAGTVLEAGDDSVYGRFVRIRHAGGYESVYGHASRLLVAEHQRVARAQVIALSGSTGVSTAPHLHFEIRKDGRPVDPRGLVAAKPR